VYCGVCYRQPDCLIFDFLLTFSEASQFTLLYNIVFILGIIIPTYKEKYIILGIIITYEEKYIIIYNKMSSVHKANNNVVDLLGSPSPRCREMKSSRKRRSPRFRRNDMSDNNNHNVRNNNGSTNKKKTVKDKSMVNDNTKMPTSDVINLADDSPPSPGLTMISTSNRKMRRKRRRRPIELTLDDDDDDDDLVEIIEPTNRKMASTAAASSSFAAAAASKQQPQSPLINEKDLVDRIREVFPLISREKAETFLSMAKSYSNELNGNKNESIFLTVMTVLSEDPLGTSITSATFAAASVGGRLEGESQSQSTGNQKVAQLECQCCYMEYEYELMVACKTGGHLFCKTCLQKHTEQRVFGLGNFGVKPNSTNGGNKKETSKALEILCMSAGCESGFQEGQLRKCLSEKVMKKYDFDYETVIFISITKRKEGRRMVLQILFLILPLCPSWPSFVFSFLPVMLASLSPLSPFCLLLFSVYVIVLFVLSFSFVLDCP